MARTDRDFLISVRADIRKAVQDLRTVREEVAGTGQASRRSSQGMQRMGATVRGLAGAAAAYLSLSLALRVLREADAWALLQARIRQATKGTGDYLEVSRELYQVAARTGSQLGATVDVFQGLARAAPELEATSGEVLKVVEAVQQLGAISGTGQAQRRAGLLQFSQALAAGTVRAEEFNSILENLPELAVRLAQGMDKTVGQLRAAVLDGEVLSKDVFAVLLEQSDAIGEDFAEMPLTLGRAGTQLANSATRLLGSIDKITGATGFLSEVMQGWASIFDRISEAIDPGPAQELANLTAERLRLLERIRELEASASPQQRALNAARRELARVQADLVRVNEEILKSREGGAEGGVDAGTLMPGEISDAARRQRLLDQLQQQADTFGMSAEQVTRYRLALLGASEAEQRRAAELVRSVEAQQAAQDLQEEGQRIYQATRTEQERLAEELERLDELYERGAFGAVGSAEALDTYARAVFDATAATEELAAAGDEAFERLIAATRGWGDEFTNTLADMVQTGKLDFKELADSIIRDLLRILIYQQVTQPLFGALGVPGFVQHAGGLAGSGPMRRVSPALFLGAPRYHGGGIAGLAPDEVPSILRRGEEVLTRDDPRHMANMGGAGSVRVEVVNRGTPIRAQQATTRMDATGMVVQIITEDVQRNGPIRRALESIRGR